MNHRHFLTFALIFANSLVASDEELGPVRVMEPVATLANPKPFTPPIRPERPRANFEVLDSKEVTHTQSTVTYRRAKPPADLPTRTVAAKPVPTAAEIQADFEDWTRKPQYATGLSVVVYDGDFSEVRWRHEGRLYRIYSDIDFGLFRSMTRFETPEAIYSNTMAYEEVDSDGRIELQRQLRAAGIPATLLDNIPEKPNFTSPEAEYIVIEGRDAFPGESDPFALMNWLHIYFNDHEAELREVRERLDEYNLAYRQWREANPEPEHKEITLTFWPGKNSAYLDKTAE